MTLLLPCVRPFSRILATCLLPMAAMPSLRYSFIKCLKSVETCIEGIPFVSNAEANTQARGLGNMVAFWERMRNICPKVNIYHGPILTKAGDQCTTDKDLDLAMLATREFWFESPPCADQAWDPVLSVYNECDPWPDISIPPSNVFIQHFCTRKTLRLDLMASHTRLGGFCLM